jgi:hypothetical protein
VPAPMSEARLSKTAKDDGIKGCSLPNHVHIVNISPKICVLLDISYPLHVCIEQDIFLAASKVIVSIV